MVRRRVAPCRVAMSAVAGRGDARRRRTRATVPRHRSSTGRRVVRGALRQLSRRRRHRRRRPRAVAVDRGEAVSRLRAAHRADAAGRPGHAGQPRPGPLLRGRRSSRSSPTSASIGDGPDIPAVDTAAGDVADGGELYRLNCAACHVASGCRRADRRRPRRPEPRRLDPDRGRRGRSRRPGLDAGVRLVHRRGDQRRRGLRRASQRGEHHRPVEFGGAGPVAEGLAAWLLGLVPLVALTRWIGRPKVARRDLDVRRPATRASRTRSSEPRPRRRQHPRRTARRSSSFVAAPIGGLIAACGYWSGSTEACSGIGLAICLGGIGFGLVSWAKYLDLDEHVVQQREPLRTTDAEQRRPRRGGRRDDRDGRPAPVARRAVRRVAGQPRDRLRRSDRLARTEAAAANGHGPRGPPGAASSRRRQPDRRRLRALDQLATVFPEGHIGADDSQVVLLRVAPDLLSERHARRRRRRRLGRLLEDLHPRRLLGRPVRRRHPGAGRAARARVPVPPVGVRSARRRQAGRRSGDASAAAAPASASTTRAILIALADFDQPVGPIAWDEA